MQKDKLNWKVNESQAIDFVNVCNEAANGLFNTFKRDERLNQILEHCPLNIAVNYYEQVKKDNPELLEFAPLINNDNYGGAKVRNINGFNCSTSTMQYIGVLSNLIKFFGSLKGKNIVEIGGGYGGQAMVIMSYFKVKSYTIIDIEAANNLQRRYLKDFKVDIKNTYRVKNYDLVISNYALSEVMEPMQTEYIEDICLHSKHGYLTCNSPLNSIEILRDYKPIQNRPDVKGEAENNHIITW